MTTLVSFELAKKLKEKGFNLPVGNYYNKECSFVQQGFSNDYWGDYTTFNWNADVVGIKPFKGFVSAPTIAEVVMWLCEKHRIWIEVIVESPNYFGYSVCNIKNNTSQDGDYVSYKSPTEAYEAAIEYTLINLL